MTRKLIRGPRAMALALLGLSACADSHGGAGVDASVQRTSDAGREQDAGQVMYEDDPMSGPWGRCGPSPLTQAVPSEVIDVAKEALRPGGWAAQDIPGFGNATNCQQATLGPAYRYGTVDTSMLNGADTPDTFVSLFNAYRMAWFCDGQPAGALEITLGNGQWQVTAHAQNTEWDTAVGKLGIDFAPDCTRAYLVRYDLGSWTVLTDKNKGVFVHQLFAGNTDDAHTKADFVAQLSKLVSR